MKAKVLIEKDEHGFSAVITNFKSTIIGSGDSVDEAKEDLMNSIEEIKNMYAEEGRESPDCLSHLTFEYKYDISALFNAFSFLNATKFAERLGISPSLMRHYKAGDTYISYERIEPLRNVLGAIADATQIFTSETAGIDLSTISGSEGMGPMEIGMTVVNAVSQNFINQSYMKGLADVMDALVNDGMGYSVEKALKDFTLSSTLPNISNTVRQAIDPEFKEVRTWMDAYRNKIPGLSGTLPARYSWITGEPSLYMGGHFSSVLPVTGSWKPKDSTLEALEQVATLLPSLPNNVMGNPLDGQQMSDYCRLHGTVKIKGKTMLQAIEAVVDKSKGSDRYDLADAVAKTVREYRNLAKQELYKLYPDLSVSKRKQQRQGRLSLPTPTTPSEGSGASVARIADQLSSF